MTSHRNLIPIPGCTHPAIPGARIVGRPDPEDVAEVTVYLRSRSPIPDALSLEEKVATGTRHLTPEEFKDRHGAEESHLERVRRYAEEHGLGVVEASPVQRRVRLQGTTQQLNRAFGVELAHFEHAAGRHRGHEGEVHVSEDLHEIVLGVFGLDDRPMAQRHGAEVGPKNLPKGSFTPPQVANAYDFPPGLDGTGECIGLIQLGGGFFQDELETYFAGIGVTMPEIVTVGKNQPGTREKAPRDNAEVALDIQVAGSIAPKAKYVFYFGDNTGPGFLNTVGEAILDRTNNPSVVSVSWGMPEIYWPEKAAEIMEHNIRAAAALGVTVCAASGDHGADDGLGGGRLAPNFPASVPSALSCGGTKLTAPDGRFKAEVVWDEIENGVRWATGGGVSSLFALPPNQKKARVPKVPKAGAKPGFAGRGVPDVAGNAAKSYLTYIDGKWGVHGGTSAVAPLWAALVAMMNQSLAQRVGFINPTLYRLESQEVFHQITSGNNGYYEAGPGWNACTGLGSPIGSKLLAALADRLKSKTGS